MRKVLSEWSQEEIDELATETCECVNARIYTHYPICEGFITAITVDIGNGVKGKINITSKGNVKVARTKTDTSTYEA